MAADFITPLFAVERVRGIIVKPTNGLHDRRDAIHRRRKVDRCSTSNLAPPFVKTLLVQKHHRELFDLILLLISMTGGAAGEEGEGYSGPGYERP